MFIPNPLVYEVRGGKNQSSEGLFTTVSTTGLPGKSRSDKEPEFTARTVRDWLGRVEARTLYIEPGSPWENGHIQGFNRKPRVKLLEREIFYTLLEVKVLTERYRRTYKRIRPHRSLGYRTLAREVLMPADPVHMLGGVT